MQRSSYADRQLDDEADDVALTENNAPLIRLSARLLSLEVNGSPFRAMVWPGSSLSFASSFEYVPIAFDESAVNFAKMQFLGL